MQSKPNERPGRTQAGKIMVLTVLLLPVLVGAAALAVDFGLQCAVQSKLRTVADASALAGARALANEFINNPSEALSVKLSAATAAAQSIASQPGNAVLGTTLTFSLGTGSGGTGGDMLVGYLNILSTTSTLDTTSGTAFEYNSVQVTAAHSAAHSNAVPSAFASIWGLTGIDVVATSTATAQLYSVKGFTPGNSPSVDILPIVMAQANYTAMIAGNTPDQYAYNPSTNTVSSGSDGIGESQLYPVASGDPGNWGTVKIGVDNNSTKTLGDQIQNGVTAAQMATFPNSTLQLDQSLTPPSLTLPGNPGLSAGIKDDLSAIIGQVRPIAIYNQTGGNGNNAWYSVVAFAYVRLMAVDFHGSNKYVMVQPASSFDTGGIPGAPLARRLDDLYRPHTFEPHSLTERIPQCHENFSHCCLPRWRCLPSRRTHRPRPSNRSIASRKTGRWSLPPRHPPRWAPS